MLEPDGSSQYSAHEVPFDKSGPVCNNRRAPAVWACEPGISAARPQRPRTLLRNSCRKHQFRPHPARRARGETLDSGRKHWTEVLTASHRDADRARPSSELHR